MHSHQVEWETHGVPPRPEYSRVGLGCSTFLVISTVDPEGATTGSLCLMAAANENSDLVRFTTYIVCSSTPVVAGAVPHFSHS